MRWIWRLFVLFVAVGSVVPLYNLHHSVGNLLTYQAVSTCLAIILGVALVAGSVRCCPSRGVKVVPESSGLRRALVLFAIGLILAPAATYLAHLTFDRALVSPAFFQTREAKVYRVTAFLLWDGVPYLLLPGLLAALSCREQRLRRAWVEAVSLAIGVGCCIAFSPEFSGFELSSVSLRVEFFVILLIFYLAARLVGLWAIRRFLCEVVVQTGSLCWTCGYNLTGNTSGICPECGTSCKQI